MALLLPVTIHLVPDDAARPIHCRSVADGQEIRVRWPVGFSARSDPGLRIVAPDGKVIAQEGVPLEGDGRWLRERRHVHGLHRASTCRCESRVVTGRVTRQSCGPATKASQCPLGRRRAATRATTGSGRRCADLDEHRAVVAMVALVRVLRDACLRGLVEDHAMPARRGGRRGGGSKNGSRSLRAASNRYRVGSP